MADLSELIPLHSQAKTVNHEAWERVGDITKLIDDRLPACRVQVSRRLGMKDDDGNDTYTPIYSYTADDIDKRCARDIDLLVSLHAHGPNAAESEQKIRDKRTAWATSKKNELASLEAERDRIENESGYTAALAEARASAEAVKSVEADIIALVPDTLEQAAKKAAWVVEAYQDDDAYLYEDGSEALIAALKAIGEAQP